MLQQNSSTNRTKAILVTGLVAGTLDITAATIASQVNPIIVCQYIASGAFGREAAFSGGALMAILGLLFHYIIAFSWTILFFLIYPKISFIAKHKIIAGLLYGVVVWVVMNSVVVPLTQIPARPFNLRSAVVGASILMLAIGLPISLLAHRYYAKKQVA